MACEVYVEGRMYHVDNMMMTIAKTETVTHSLMKKHNKKEREHEYEREREREHTSYF